MQTADEVITVKKCIHCSPVFHTIRYLLSINHLSPFCITREAGRKLRVDFLKTND